MKQVVCEVGLLFGGNANNGSPAGSFYVNTNNAPTNANSNIGSHLCLIKYSCRPWLLPKNDNINK